MEDIDLLPSALQKQSLSHQEIVLPYQEAVQALHFLSAANWALLGWEAWLRFPSGAHLHPMNMAFDTPVREFGETWDKYVLRSGLLCQETMEIAQHQWEIASHEANMTLHFCLTSTDR